MIERFRCLLRLRRVISGNLSKSASFEKGGSFWAQISDGRGRRPPTTVDVRKLEWLPFRVVSKYLQCIVWFCHKTRVWQTDGQTDGQNYDFQDRASIAASRGRNVRSKHPLWCNVVIGTLALDVSLSHLVQWSDNQWSVHYSYHPTKVQLMSLEGCELITNKIAFQSTGGPSANVCIWLRPNIPFFLL